MPTYIQVHGVNQNPAQKTSWSPFGPATPNLIIHDYSDFNTMFTAFSNGQIDITDWPIRAPDLNSFCSNVDIWCSSPDPEFGIFQADINNHAPFLGKTMEIARPSLVGSLTNVVSGSSSACSNGNGQLTLNVVNIENNTQTFKDSLNTITIGNQPSGTPSTAVTDQGGSNPNGIYKFPCILSGVYELSGTMITGNATSGAHLGCGVAAGCTVVIPAGSSPNGGTVSATWNVVWNSPSTLTPTAVFPNIMKAIAHLVDKPEFVQHDAALQGHASCDDTMLAPAHLIQGSPCVSNPIGSGQPGSPFPAAVLNGECASSGGIIALDSIITSCSPISAYNLVDDNIGSGAVWWGVPGRSGVGGVATGYSGSADVDAACQYLKAAGFTLSGATTAPTGTQPNTCAELAVNTVGTTAPNATSYTHFTAPSGTHFLVLLRNDPPRGHFGQVIADTINMLFGTPNDSGTCPATCTQTSTGTATVLYYNAGGALQPTATYNSIGPAVPIVFGDGGTGKADGWNLYTGGFSLGSTPDFLFSNYHSEFGSSACNGPFNNFPSNYVFHCDPAFDAISNAGEFQATSAPTLTSAAAIFQDAALRAFNVPINLAVYSRIQQFAALNGWNWQQLGGGQGSSIVIQKGHGTQTGFWSLLNARNVPGYTTANAIYTPGGGNPNLIRRGFSQDPDTLNPYQALTVWDFEIINQVFDSMLQVNPETAGANQEVIDWMTTSHSASFNPNELGCIPPPSVATPICARGIVTQTWHLRNDVFFHDGFPVNAQDVVYSILTTRDDPSANAFTSAAFVTNAVALDSKTIQVKLQSNSPYYELNIGSIPIIPQHLWGPVCGRISPVSTPGGTVSAVTNGPASACADPSFDPLTCTGSLGPVASCGTSFPDGSFLGIFVGSADYVCNNADPAAGTFSGHRQAFGKPGGSCVQSGAGALIGGGSFGPDSRALLQGYTSYMRGIRGGQGNSLQKQSWADYNDDGVVNILDASNAAFFFGSSSLYWGHPQYACSPTATTVDICVVSAIVLFFNEGLTAPFGGTNVNPSTQLSMLDPQIDPYSLQLSGTIACLSYQTTTTVQTQFELLTCGNSLATTLPAGHTITSKAFPVSSSGTLGVPVVGSVVVSSNGNGVSTWSPSLSAGSQNEIVFYDNGIQIGQFFATP